MNIYFMVMFPTCTELVEQMTKASGKEQTMPFCIPKTETVRAPQVGRTGGESEGGAAGAIQDPSENVTE